jgi:uncharacterized protein (DUF2141 family)
MAKLWWSLAMSFLAATSVDGARDGGASANADAPGVQAPGEPRLAVTVSVEVTGLASSRGVVECVLWAGPDGFPTDTARAQAKVQVKGLAGPSARCTFDAVPRGTYAVTMSHDENENGKVDKNFLGIPLERYGFSNNPRPFMRAPRFDEAAFVVSSAPVVLQLLAE